MGSCKYKNMKLSKKKVLSSADETFNIATFNVHNNYLTYDYDGKQVFNDLRRLNIDIDILGMQEVTPTLFNSFKEFYQNIVGDNRLKENSVFYHYFSELNPIVTKFEIVNSETIWLSKDLYKKGSSSFFSVFPRVVTLAAVDVPGVGITICINTHLDHLFNYTKRRQLEILFEIISVYMDYPVVLMGDFNLDDDSKLLANFKLKLSSIGLKEVSYSGSSFDTFDAKLDHIFIPKTWDVVSTETFDIDSSDHKLILTKCRNNFGKVN